jgi:hypothetical protein
MEGSTPSNKYKKTPLLRGFFKGNTLFTVFTVFTKLCADLFSNIWTNFVYVLGVQKKITAKKLKKNHKLALLKN